jgi:hypothetical protein
VFDPVGSQTDSGDAIRRPDCLHGRDAATPLAAPPAMLPGHGDDDVDASRRPRSAFGAGLAGHAQGGRREQGQPLGRNVGPALFAGAVRGRAETLPRGFDLGELAA